MASGMLEQDPQMSHILSTWEGLQGLGFSACTSNSYPKASLK